MVDPYRFEYDGQTIEFARNTVRSTLEAERLQNKLLGALGYITGNPATADVAADIAEYSELMSRTKTDAAWWAHSNMTESDVGERYNVYMNEHGSLVASFRKAADATAMPKKT